MTTTAPPRRPAVGTRRAGYVVAVLVNAAMLIATNAWPGWETVGFLTEDTRQVLPLVNGSILVGLVANVLYIVRDPRGLRALGDVVTTSVGLAALVRIWQVFPFDPGSDPVDWALVLRVLLGLGIVGSVIGIIAALVTLVRGRTRS